MGVYRKDIEKTFINVPLNTPIHIDHKVLGAHKMLEKTVFGTMMENSQKYTSLKLSCILLLKCTELNPFCNYFWTVSSRCWGQLVCFDFGFATIWDSLSSLIGNYLVLFYYTQLKTALKHSIVNCFDRLLMSHSHPAATPASQGKKLRQ